MDFEVRSVVPVDHPSLAGHFPDHPVVPGVVLLEEVIDGLARWREDGKTVSGIPTVKFAAPLRPGQTFVIRYTRVGERRVKFRCLRDEQPFAWGELALS